MPDMYMLITSPVKIGEGRTNFKAGGFYVMYPNHGGWDLPWGTGTLSFSGQSFQDDFSLGLNIESSSLC